MATHHPGSAPQTQGRADHGDHGHADGDGHHHQHPLSDRLPHRWKRLAHAIRPHSHDAGDVVDDALEASKQGMRALWISFLCLMATATAQLVLVTFTGSVALLGDTVHNFADALTAVPLAVAFLLGRRAATRRFTYGFGRGEDLAGLIILAVITASAVFAGWQAVDRLIDPRPVTAVGWVAAAGFVGFIGNELVARYRITVGRRIGSAALVADGLHARTDGFTSLAVLLAAAGAWVGWQWVDPVVGLLITVAILSVLWGASAQVLARTLDAVEPRLVSDAEQALAGTPGVRGVDSVRLRWIGHRLTGDAVLQVGPDLTLRQAHHITHEARLRMKRALPRLDSAIVHARPGSGAH